MKKLQILLIGIIVIIGITIINKTKILADTGYDGAIRIESGRNPTTTQIACANSATTLISASNKVACTIINNLSLTNKVAIGGASITFANGYVLSTSTGTFNTMILYGYTGALSCISDGANATLSVFQCATNQ